MQERLSALLCISNAQQRLASLVEAARSRASLPDVLRREEYQVQGCLVRTWFVPRFRDGQCEFQCDSDAAMLKAVIGLLCDTFSGCSPEEIAAQDPAEWLQETGVSRQLAENRQRTVLRVAEQVKNFAQKSLAA
jgi:cysteine desulfuration protein SufE